MSLLKYTILLHNKLNDCVRLYFKLKPYMDVFKFNIYTRITNISWCGGREDIDEPKYNPKMVDFLNSKGIGVFLCFSNILPRLEDEPTAILNHLNLNPLNGVIVANDGLKDLIKSKYSNLKIERSIIGLEGIEPTDEYLSEFDYFCVASEWRVDPNFNAKDNFLLLLNDPCVLNCKMQHRHNLFLSNHWNRIPDHFECIHPNKKGLIINEEQINKYMERGYKCFKFGPCEFDYIDKMLKKIGQFCKTRINS